jgi:hypothetical protein
MQRDERHFSVEVDELAPAPVPATAGWVPTMDIRYVDQASASLRQTISTRLPAGSRR